MTSNLQIGSFETGIPVETGDWSAVLRHHTDSLDAVLDDFDQHVLEEMLLELSERAPSFVCRGARELAASNGDGVSIPAASDELEQPVFANPLLVVIAAYLAVHRDRRSQRERLDARVPSPPVCSRLLTRAHLPPLIVGQVSRRRETDSRRPV